MPREAARGPACTTARPGRPCSPWRDGLAWYDLNDVYVDDDGNAWFATADRGLSRYDGATWTTYTEEDGLADDIVFATVVHPNGDLWVGTVEGLSRFDGNTWTTYTDEDGLAGNHHPLADR